jgi:outer membrane protein insertion porin family
MSHLSYDTEKLIKNLNIFKSFLVFIICAFAFNAFAIDDIGKRRNLFKIDGIEIEGSKKVEREAILEKISSKKGIMLDNYLLRKDIQKIYSLKYFDWVESHHRVVKGKNILVFKVKEKPIVTKIIFEGNDEVDEDDLTSQLKTKEFSILDVNTIKLDLTALQKFYEEKGFYLASVDYELRDAGPENLDLVFKIKEYEKVLVKKISFFGNKAFSDDEIKGIMETREESLFSFMSGSGNFKEFNFNIDVERIKDFYKTKGYLLVNVGTPAITVSEDRKWVFISIKVTEGPQFNVRDITFQGEVLFEEGELHSKLGLKTGETYSEALLRKDVQLLTEMYQDKGYAFANVLRTLHPVPGENKVDVEFSFEKGKIAYFGKITVKGNSKTRDKVVRRELKIHEGSMFSGTRLRESKENVNRLGFFEPGSVVFNTVSPQGKDDVLDVEIQVKERNTGQISLGAGYSTATGAFLQASIAQNNFRGLGQNLSFSLNIADNNRTFNIGFTEPYLFDSKWTAGGDIFVSKDSQSISYNYKREGFDIRVGYPIFEYTRLFMTYKFEDTTLEEVNDPTIDPELENGIASTIKGSILRDKRNNRMEPSKGYYLSISSEFAGLGGDKEWLRNEFDGRFFHRVTGDLVFRSRLFAGKIEKDGREIPRTELYTLGGSRNLRGYAYEEIGPKRTVQAEVGGVLQDITFNAGAPMSAYTQLELEHPLAREAGLKWVVFFDAGDAAAPGDFDLKMDYGFGFRWFSPIGVLRFEFGYPIGEEDSGSQFHFDIGQLF